MLHNAATAFSALLLISGIVGLVWPVVRKDSPARRIPWWWWLAIGVSSIVLGYANSVDFWNGTLLLLGAFAVGIGVTLLVVGIRDRSIRIRPRTAPSEWDRVATDDWRKGAEMIRVASITAEFGNFLAPDPYIEFDIPIVNLSLHMPWIQSDVHGHIQAQNERGTWRDLTHVPELVRYTERDQTHEFPRDGRGVARNGSLTLVLRQHLLPDIRDQWRERAGQAMPFNFAKVDIDVVFTRRIAGQQERSARQRIPVDTAYIEMPDWLQDTPETSGQGGWKLPET